MKREAYGRAAAMAPMRRRIRGASYLGVLTALAILTLAFAVLFPVLTQAGRNAAAAREGYTAAQTAQEIMLAVRAALENGSSHEAAVAALFGALPEPHPRYAYWVGGDRFSAPEADGAPPMDAGLSFAADDALPAAGEVPVLAWVWTPDGRLAGRAMGLAVPDAAEGGS